MSNSPTRLHLTCLSLSEEGQGVCSEGELEVRVLDLLPGEQAEVEIDHRSQHKKQAWGHIVERVGELSTERRSPLCPAFGACGGCSWQHLSYEAQLEQKRLRVQEAMRSQLADPPPVPSPAPSPKRRAYRNKGKYVFGLADGEIRLGAYKTRTHEFVSTHGCAVVMPEIDALAGLIAEHSNRLQLPVYSEAVRAPGMRYAIVRANKAGKALVTLVCSSQTSSEGLQSLAAALIADSRVCGVLRCNNDLRSGGLLSDDIQTLAGESTLPDEILGVQVALGPHSFWQVNREQATQAYQDLAAALPMDQSRHVLELYSGVGGIAFVLSKSGRKVVGIERAPEAVAAANTAAESQGIAHRVSFTCGDATSIGPEYFQDVHSVVVDPPRKGLGKKGLEQLARAMPQRIAYLSCNPDSLSSDLAYLVASGYRIESLSLYDFMPGTSQIESLALLVRPAPVSAAD